MLTAEQIKIAIKSIEKKKGRNLFLRRLYNNEVEHGRKSISTDELDRKCASLVGGGNDDDDCNKGTKWKDIECNNPNTSSLNVCKDDNKICKESCAYKFKQCKTYRKVGSECLNERDQCKTNCIEEKKLCKEQCSIRSASKRKRVSNWKFW